MQSISFRHNFGSMNNLDRKTERDETSDDSRNNRGFIPRVSPLPILDNYEIVPCQFREPMEFKETTPKDRRRERNKILARNNRLRKKVELDAMQEKIAMLEQEVVRLSRQNSSENNDTSINSINDLLSPGKFSCNTSNDSPHPSSLSVPGMLTIQLSPSFSSKIMATLQRMIGIPPSLSGSHMSRNHHTNELLTRYVEQRPFYVVSTIGHFPIVYASQSFATLCGHDLHTIIGRNCGFLHGEKTDQTEVDKLNHCILNGVDVSARLLNYRKDGTAFWNQVQLGHVKDETGRTQFIVAVHIKIGTSASQANTDTHLLDDFVSDFIVTGNGVATASSSAFHRPAGNNSGGKDFANLWSAKSALQRQQQQQLPMNALQKQQQKQQQHQQASVPDQSGFSTPPSTPARTECTPAQRPLGKHSGLRRSHSSTSLFSADNCSVSEMSDSNDECDSSAYSYSRCADDMEGIEKGIRIASCVSPTTMMNSVTTPPPVVRLPASPLDRNPFTGRLVTPTATRGEQSLALETHPVSGAAAGTARNSGDGRSSYMSLAQKMMAASTGAAPGSDAFNVYRPSIPVMRTSPQQFQGFDNHRNNSSVVIKSNNTSHTDEASAEQVRQETSQPEQSHEQEQPAHHQLSLLTPLVTAPQQLPLPYAYKAYKAHYNRSPNSPASASSSSSSSSSSKTSTGTAGRMINGLANNGEMDFTADDILLLCTEELEQESGYFIGSKPL